MNWRYLFFELNGDGTETVHPGRRPRGEPEPRPASSPAPTRSPAASVLGPLGSCTLTTARRHQADGSPRSTPSTTTTRSGSVDHLRLRDRRRHAASSTSRASRPTRRTSRIDAEISAVQEDPLNLTRQLWDHLQMQPGGNLGLVLDDDRVTRARSAPGRPNNTSDGPDDAELVVDRATSAARSTTSPRTLRSTTWRSTRSWVRIVTHRLRLDYPTIGTQKPDLRFVLGENVKVLPSPRTTAETTSSPRSGCSALARVVPASVPWPACHRPTRCGR
jgi:hypothetical protein